MRSLPLRLVVTTLALACLAGCDSVQETRDNLDQGVAKARDCAALAEKVTGVNINPDAAASELEQQAKELEETVNNLGSEDVKRAGQGLLTKVEELASAARNADRAEVERSLTEVRDAAAEVARACNLPVDQLVN